MITVVIADDHPAIRRLIRQLLMQSQTIRIVAEAASGAEALECVREQDPDVITLDMMMGDMNGLEVLHELKKLAEPPRVVAISLYDAPQLIQRALEEGADAYLVKRELSPAKLIDTVKEVTAA